jgi:hypothetical protein
MVQLFDPNAAGNPKRTSPLVLTPDYHTVENNGVKYPVMTAQTDVVYMGARTFELTDKSIYYLKPKGGATGGILGKGGKGGGLPGQGSGGMIGPGPGGGKMGGFPGGAKGGGGNDKKYKEKLLPVHAVVVTGTFPVKDQLEYIRKALRYNSVEELFKSDGDGNPEFYGLAVMRRELSPDGKTTQWIELKLDDPNGVTMKEYAKYKGFEPEDDEQLKHIFAGLVMPRPPSMTTHYPLLDLKDIPKGEPKKEDLADARQPGGILGGMMGGGPGGIGGAGGPGAGGPGGGGRPGGGFGGQPNQPMHYDPQSQNLSELPKDYEGPDEPTQAKFNREFDIFEVGGFRPEEGDKAVVGTPKNPPGIDSKMKGIRPPGPGDMAGPGGQFSKMMQQAGQTSRVAGLSPDKQPDKALVRFVDITVKPGKIYQYMVKVRLRNPNYKKKRHEVATSDLVKKKFLESAWVYTEPVPVGPEIQFYAVDQKLIEPQQDFKRRLAGTETSETRGERVAVQIHRFLGSVQDKLGTKEGRGVGEWSIAERLLVPRGEFVGHKVEVEVPCWDPNQDDFDLINGRVVNRLTGQKEGKVAIDFSTHLNEFKGSAALVVDFRGGKHDYIVERLRNNTPCVDEAATELLILGADGKLAVRNSRFEADPQNPRQVERAARLEHLRERLQQLKHPQPRNLPTGGAGKGGGT